MATIKSQDINVADLPWRVEYEENRCSRCGDCVAACSFSAIKMAMEQRCEYSPSGTKKYRVPVVKQQASLANACTGCGICQRVCANDAIRPQRQGENRYACIARSGGNTIKRGGRALLREGRHIDHVYVGRISQMTDPPLDAERHTFDIVTPFGRTLPPEKLPLAVTSNGSLEMTANVPPVRWLYPVIFGDMSIGALSTRAWEAIALATAYLNEKCNIPVAMCSGEGGMPDRLLKSDYVKYMIIQIASGHFGWNRIVNAIPYMQADPAGILIKIGQGAKPGDGGFLPAAKVAEHIQAIRGVHKADLLSPPNHQGLYSIEESVQKMHMSMSAAFKFRVPVAIKVSASATSVAVYNNLLRDPYNICGGLFIDGIFGGTGAANEISLNHSGHPLMTKVRECYSSAVAQGRQGQIPLWAGGGVGMTGDVAADAFKLICLGANGVFISTILLQLMGCVTSEFGRCNACHSGKCPTGICTQDPLLVKRLDVDKAAQAIVEYMLAVDKEFKKLMAPIGNSSLPVGRADALVTTDRDTAEKLGIAYAC